MDIWPKDSGRIEIYPNNVNKEKFEIIKIRCKEKLDKLHIEEYIGKKYGFRTSVSLSSEEAVLAMADAVVLMCNTLDNN